MGQQQWDGSSSGAAAAAAAAVAAGAAAAIKWVEGYLLWTTCIYYVLNYIIIINQDLVMADVRDREVAFGARYDLTSNTCNHSIIKSVSKYTSAQDLVMADAMDREAAFGAKYVLYSII